MIPFLVIITGRYNCPARTAMKNCGATIISTTWLWFLVTTTHRRSPAGAAPSSCTCARLAERRHRAVSLLNKITCAMCCHGPGLERFCTSARNSTIYPLLPKIALPTRTWVAPSSIAVSTSPLIPMLTSARPLRFANVGQQGDMRRGDFIKRRHAHHAGDIKA